MLTEVSNSFYFWRERFFEDEQNRRQGEYLSWFNNTLLRNKCFFIDDKLHGEYMRWFESGQLEQHCFYVEGKKHGEDKRWRENGTLWEHGFYVNGKQHGEYMLLRRDDVMSNHCFYFEGKQVSFKELPRPITPEDRMYFVLKYDLPLLPVESTC